MAYKTQKSSNIQNVRRKKYISLGSKYPKHWSQMQYKIFIPVPIFFCNIILICSCVYHNTSNLIKRKSC